MSPSTTPNPFADLVALGQEILGAIHQVLARQDAVRPEWEPLTVAMATRRKGKLKLLAAVQDGRVRSKRVPSRGQHDAWLLSTHDLDQHFPATKK